MRIRTRLACCRTSSSPIRPCCRSSPRQRNWARAGRGDKDSFWNLAAYRTDLADDIQFIAAGSGAVNAGYFQNIGHTRREGIEIGAGAPFGPLALTARYSYTRATYRTPFTEASPNNTTANADGTITVLPGDSLPGIPRHLLKLRGAWTIDPALRNRRDDGRRQQPDRARQREQSRSRRRRTRLRRRESRCALGRRPAVGGLRQRDQPLQHALPESRRAGVELLSRPRQYVRARARGTGGVPLAGRRHSACGSGSSTISACGAVDCENGDALLPTKSTRRRRAAARSGGSLPPSRGPCCRPPAPRRRRHPSICARRRRASTCRCSFRGMPD